MTTKNFQTDIITSFISSDGDKSIEISKTGLSLKRDLLTIPKETILTPLDITDINTGNSISFDDLTYLPTGLGALTVPSNTLTCNFNDAIQVQDYNATLDPPLVHSEAKLGANPLSLFGLQFTSTENTTTIISNNNSNDMNITADGSLTCVGNNLNLNASDNVSINATNDAITITADDNITITSAGEGNINLDAPNINSYGWAMPICLNVFETASYSYGAGGQILQDVYQVSFNLPNQFFSNTPQSGYTATRWQINFDMNMFSMSSNSDKGFAIFFELWDSNSNVYKPFLYNIDTPFCRWNNPATFNNGTYGNFNSVNWCDYVDLGGMAGTFDGNLTLHLFIAGDNTFTADFKMKMGLTRINRI